MVLGRGVGHLDGASSGASKPPHLPVSGAYDESGGDPHPASHLSVAIVTDRPYIGESLAVALAAEGTVVAAVIDCDSWVDPGETSYDVFLLAATDRIHEIAVGLLRERPTRRLVALVDTGNGLLMRSLLESGVSGIVDDRSSLGTILQSLHTVAGGHSAIPQAVLAQVLRLTRPGRPTPAEVGDALHLTLREHEILALLSVGNSTEEMAAELYLSINTVRSYVQGLMAKLDAHSRLEAVAKARRLGLVASDARTA